MSEVSRSERSRALRAALAPYAGGSFRTGESGGAGGMIFFRDAEGREFYIGGFQGEHADRLAKALTLVVELLDDPPPESSRVHKSQDT